MAARSVAVLFAALLLAATVSSLAPRAQAADVSRLLITKAGYHFDTPTSTEGNLTVTVGDTIRLRIENQETTATNHTFTAPHFPAVANQGGAGSFLNVTMTQGRVFFWNYTVTSADIGTWQFYCIPHSTGTYPSRTGMTGSIIVRAPADNTLLIVGGVVGVVAIVGAAAAVMRRKKSKPPMQPPTQ